MEPGFPFEQAPDLFRLSRLVLLQKVPVGLILERFLRDQAMEYERRQDGGDEMNRLVAGALLLEHGVVELEGLRGRLLLYLGLHDCVDSNVEKGICFGLRVVDAIRGQVG